MTRRRPLRATLIWSGCLACEVVFGRLHNSCRAQWHVGCHRGTVREGWRVVFGLCGAQVRRIERCPTCGRWALVAAIRPSAGQTTHVEHQLKIVQSALKAELRHGCGGAPEGCRRRAGTVEECGVRIRDAETAVTRALERPATCAVVLGVLGGRRDLYVGGSKRGATRAPVRELGATALR